MNWFDARLRALVELIRRDPSDSTVQAELEALLAAHPTEFEEWLPGASLAFDCSPHRQPRRVRFLKHLLGHGYLPPRVDVCDGSAWRTTINMGVITGYFYSNALSLLEAAQFRHEIAVFVATPNVNDAPWITVQPHESRPQILLHAALMLDDEGLVWRRFTEPVPLHYLFPVDNYAQAKYRLVQEYGSCRVPMAGSALIREVVEDKTQLSAIAGNIPMLRLAREVVLEPGDSPVARKERVVRLCETHRLNALVTKPVDEFGGTGVRFWRYPQDFTALLAHVEQALGERAALLVQERIVPVPSRSGREWNLRQYVVRGPGNVIQSRWKRVRIGSGVINTTQGAQSLTVEALLADIDLPPEQHPAFMNALESTDALSIAVMDSLESYLRQRMADQEQPYLGSGSNLVPDILALDFMIAPDPEANDFAVYLNEINDFASGGMRDYEVLAHRLALPNADAVRATQPFSLAPAILDLAYWRGTAYRQACMDHTPDS